MLTNSYDVKLDQSKLVGLLSKKRGGAELLEAILNQALELQMKDHLDADKYQHSPERRGIKMVIVHANYTREWAP